MVRVIIIVIMIWLVIIIVKVIMIGWINVIWWIKGELVIGSWWPKNNSITLMLILTIIHRYHVHHD